MPNHIHLILVPPAADRLTVLRGAGVGLPVTLVHAADGKTARAEPVAVLFESGKANFAGRSPSSRTSWRG